MTQAKLLEKSIIEQLPQIPFVIDQVGAAMKWVKEVKDEGEYIKTLKLTLDVAEYATKVSDVNFYRTHLVIGALLMDIDDAVNSPNFEIFKSASNSVEKTLKLLRADTKVVEERGCFKALILHLIELAKTNEDCLVVLLYSILADLKDILDGMKKAGVKTPITAEDYISVLGYAFMLTNVRMADPKLLDSTREVLNKIDIVLSNDFNY